MIGRAFIVLGAFDAKSPRLTQSEISRRSGLPLPTVHRLCGRLVAEGALERRSDGKYQVGVRLWEIGALAPGAHGLRQVALPFLEDLYEVTRENVQLVVREGTEALYLERLSSRSAVTVVGRAGGRLPLHASSGGLILLAHGGTELLDDVLRAGLESFTPKTITSERILRATLDEIRRAGFVVCREYLNVGTLPSPLLSAKPGAVSWQRSRQLFRWSRIRLLYCRRWSRPPVEYHAGLVAVGFDSSFRSFTE